MNFSDPFGLCPDDMREDVEACLKWNQQQVDKAKQIIEDERARGNPHALPESKGEIIVGINGDDTPTSCEKPSGEQSDTGCESGGVVYVNADRAPAAISQTIVHERQHEWGKNPWQRSDHCARRRAIRYVENMPKALRDQAHSGNLPAYGMELGTDSGCFR